MKDLENIATSFPGIDKAYAISAGREIRVIVEPKQIDDLSAKAFSVTSQGNIHIFFKPCRKTNVPTTPKFSNGCRNVGIIKILQELKAKHSAQTASHV